MKIPWNTLWNYMERGIFHVLPVGYYSIIAVLEQYGFNVYMVVNIIGSRLIDLSVVSDV